MNISAALNTSAQTAKSPLLFLDFDGVLHPYGTRVFDENYRWANNPELFCWLPILHEILAPHPTVKIVVSSDWRGLFDDENLIRLLGPVGDRFDGVTTTGGGPRSAEILEEVSRRKSSTWLAIDDHPSVVDASAQEQRFIACAPDSGLSAPTVQATLRARLAEFSAANSFGVL
ncbi:HAD domain-containing protein [Burkholderia sp. MR1-5-21]